MACYHPLRAYRSKILNSSGKRSITFDMNQGFVDQTLDVGCGQCIGCRLKRSRQWAIRCVHEASLYENNCFLTLTYEGKYLPLHNSLKKSDFQKFMKRLRKAHTGLNIRFFHCGEYGEQNNRPHYHALIFNYDFKDKTEYKEHNGYKYYVSKELQELWPWGFSTIGAVTFETAAYTARYITKKIMGKAALFHYTDFDRDTGEISSERTPEYITMSRRPGIGRAWLDKYKTDLYPDDFVVLKGKKLSIPKYYNIEYEKEEPDAYEKIKHRRILAGKAQAENSTRERLDVREEIHLNKFKQLKRAYENET